MGIVGWSAVSLGAWWLLTRKQTAAPAIGVPAAPVGGAPIQPVTNTVGADEQVALAIASGNPNQMRLVAAQLRAAGYPSQATTLENTALGLQTAGAVPSLINDIKGIL